MIAMDALRIVAAMALLAPMATAAERGADSEKSQATATDANGQLAETVGVLAGLHLYQTYLNIGFIADGRAEGTYQEQDARQLLASVLAPLDQVDQQLEKVGKLVQDKKDRETAEKVRRLAALLRRQGKELETFWSTEKESDGAKYEATRKRAWDEISSLLALRGAPPKE
jgi:hypothetical protein